MQLEQLSIFLENRVGRLAEITGTLKNSGVDMKAISLADTSEFGILRLIVDKHDIAKAALKEKGYTVGSTSVVAVEVPHTPGGLDSIVQMLGEGGINIEYMYGFPLMEKRAIMVFRMDNTEKALEVFQKRGIHVLSNEDVCA